MKPQHLRAISNPVPAGAPNIGRGAAAGPGTWSTFWRDFGLEDAPNERCHIPGDERESVDRHWAEFANGLPRGTRVIDLGCGAGILGRTLLDRRGDLHVTGVDWASVPVAARANLAIRPRVRMEELPFGDGCFDAAVSLFGIEYGDIDKVARELGRVLAPGAPFGFLVHHRESRIMREGCARRRALRELIAGKMKLAFLAGNLTGIDQQRRRLKAQFPEEPMVDLVGDHFRRNVARGRAERQALWQKLADGLDPEIALLMHLERSARSAAGMGAWLVPLLSVMGSVGVSVLRLPSGEPVAWDVGGRR